MTSYTPTDPALASSPCHKFYTKTLQTLDALSSPTVLALAETFNRVPSIGAKAVTFSLHAWETSDAGLGYDDIIELANCYVSPDDVEVTVTEQIGALPDGTPIHLAATFKAPLPPDAKATLISLGKITTTVQHAYVSEYVNCNA
jgi:hypothetical protein